MRRLTLRTLLITGALIFSSGLIYAQVSFRTGDPNGIAYRIPALTQVTVDEQGVCRKLTNNSAFRDYFIPSNNLTEWNTVINSDFFSSSGEITFSNCLPPTTDYYVDINPGDPQMTCTVTFTDSSTISLTGFSGGFSSNNYVGTSGKTRSTWGCVDQFGVTFQGYENWHTVP